MANINFYDVDLIKTMVKIGKWGLTTKRFGGPDFQENFPGINNDIGRDDRNRLRIVFVYRDYAPITLILHKKDEWAVYKYNMMSQGIFGYVRKYFNDKEYWHFDDAERSEFNAEAEAL